MDKTPFLLYGCTNENNECEKRESCKRYIIVNDEAYDVVTTTLFKSACSEENDYQLFIEN